MIRAILSNQLQSNQPRRSRRPWSVLLPWALAGAILVGTAVYALLPSEVKTQPPPGRSAALVWGNGVFSNALELEAWLRIRGASYKTWARRHPAGVKLIAPRPVPLARKLPNAPVKK